VRRSILVLLSVALLSGALGGCSKCGFWWDEARPGSCKGDFPK